MRLEVRAGSDCVVCSDFEDFFELSGSWPEWLRLYAPSDGGGNYSL